MADVSITSSEVFASALGHFHSVSIAGEEITAGTLVYLDGSNEWRKPAVPPGGGWGVDDVRGIALNHAYAGQPVMVVTEDPALVLGASAALVTATAYVMSATLGSIRPITDLSSGQYVFHVGIAADSATLNLKISGVASPIP